jgi:hypothetical protein
MRASFFCKIDKKQYVERLMRAWGTAAVSRLYITRPVTFCTLDFQGPSDEQGV